MIVGLGELLFSGVILRDYTPLEAAIDFRITYATAQLVRQGRAAEIYELDAQMAVQNGLLDAEDALQERGDAPWVYLPVFALAVAPLAFLPAKAALLVWAWLNGALALFIFLRLARALGLSGTAVSLLALTSFPLFYTVFLGQSNVWVLLGFSEFYAALRSGRERRAGLWLGLLLIKPQLLPLLLVVLAWKGRWRALQGFAAGAGALLLASLVLVGVASLDALADILRSYGGVSGGPNTVPRLMANWRGIAANWIQPHSGAFAAAFIVVASGVTVVLGLLPWRGVRWEELKPERFDALMLGLMAATLLSAYHSHLHTAVLLLVPALFLYATAVRTRASHVPVWTVDLAVLGPSVAFTMVLLGWGVTVFYALYVTGQAVVVCLLPVVLVGAWRGVVTRASEEPALPRAQGRRPCW